MPPLDLDDLAALQAELEVLDERDLIAELAPTGVVRRPAPRVARPTSVHPVAPPTIPRADPGPATRPPVRRLPPVPAPADRPVRRSGPLPTVAPTRDTVVEPAPVTGEVCTAPVTGEVDAAPVTGEVDATPARPVRTRPPVPGMTVVRVLPAVPLQPSPAPAVPAPTAGRRPRHAALPAVDEPAGRGLLSWAIGEERP